jgi:hypothetical protein
VATSTLAAGVNLPAGRVLIRSLSIGRDALGVMQYRQMCGRAGRMGHGAVNYGESFLLVKSLEKTRAMQLVTQRMPAVLSQLHPSEDGGNALMKALLEVVGIGLCVTVQQAIVYVQQTLLYFQSVHQLDMSTSSSSTQDPFLRLSGNILNLAVSVLAFLVNARILDCDESIGAPVCSETIGVLEGEDVPKVPTAKLKISRLGRAIMQSNVDPDEGIAMYDSLLRAQDGLHLETYLQLVYLVAPLEHVFYPDFKKMLNIYEVSHRSKNPVAARIFETVGIDYATLNRWQVKPPTKAMVDVCSSAVKMHGLRGTTSTATSSFPASSGPVGAPQQQQLRGAVSFSSMHSDDWLVLSRCKRLWAASILMSLLDGRPLQQLAKEHIVDAIELINLLKSAQMMLSKAQRFCDQVGWTALDRILSDFKPVLQQLEITLELARCGGVSSGFLLSKMDEIDPTAKHVQQLLSVPGMSAKVAKLLAQRGIINIPHFLAVSAPAIVNMLQLSVGFELQVSFHFFLT